MTPAQCRAARALVDIDRAQLSGLAVVPRAVIEADLAALRVALEQADVEFTNSEPPGVRLRKGWK